MFKFLKITIIATVVFICLDMIWLGFIAPGIYQYYLGNVIALTVHWPSAIAFYFVYISGLVYFGILPGIESKSIQKTIINTALLGGLCYATYDLTNQATIQNWPLTITLIDITWGMVLSGSVAGITYSMYTRFLKQ